jgi:hypothetical protein
MSDPTKKSIVINTSFLSSSGAGSELGSGASRNKSRKHTRQKIPDEVIKPSKLKQILLDKINAKRKAELTMTTAAATNSLSTKSTNHKKGSEFGGSGSGNGNANGGIDKEKEARIFSDEFKKSLNFLDKYIQTKQTEKSDKHHHRQHLKTLKKTSGTSSTSLNEDILKSLHSNRNNNNNNNNNHNTTPHRTQLNVNTQLYQKPSATYGSNIMQRSVSPSRPVSPASTPTFAPVQRGVSFTTQAFQPQPHAHTSGFQKIQLNVPKVNNNNNNNNNHVSTYASAPKNEKITLALGKSIAHGTAMTDAGNLIYTELPPELMPTAPMAAPMLTLLPDPMPMPITHEPAPMIETFSMPTPSPTPSPTSSPLSIPSTTLSTSTPTFSPIKLTDDKPYGCLKHGKKPTFRLYNKTIKHSHSHSHSDSQNTENKNESVLYSERQQKLNDLRNKHNPKSSSGSSSSSSSSYISGDGELENDEKEEKGEKRENKMNNSTSSSSSNRATKIRKRLRKTITKRFKLGKQGNVVGVLIKNNDTRKKIQKEHSLLKNKNLSDVKKYLVEQKLIKIGSTAPPNIIRKIYEDSVLTGEVENSGKDIVLHNFLEQNKPW